MPNLFEDSVSPSSIPYRHPLAAFVLLLACLGLWPVGSAQAATGHTAASPVASTKDNVPLIRLDDTTSTVILGDKVEYLKDPHGQFTVEDIQAGRHEEAFFHIKEERANFGFDTAVYWMRFRVSYLPRNPHGEQTWWVAFEYPLLDYVDVHYRDQRGRPMIFEGGDLRPISNNGFRFSRAIFGVTLAPGEERDILIRIQSESSYQVGLNLHSTQTMADTIATIRLQDGVFFGIMLIMMLYNLFVFLAVRDAAYLYYVAAITVFIVGQFTINGLTWQYVAWKNPEWNNILISSSYNLTWTFLLLFSRAFLQTRERAPMLDGVLRFMAISTTWMTILCLFTDYSFNIQLSTRLTMVYAVISTGIGFALWRRGHASARYFTLAWAGYMSGVLFAMLYLFGMLPYNYFTANGIQLGAFAQVLLLSLGLADRINQQRKETEVARRRALQAREEVLAANKRALANLEKFQRLYENASEGIFQCSFDGRFLSANPALANIFGYASSESLIQSVDNIAQQCCHDPADRLDFERIVMEKGRIAGHEARYIKQDGTAFWGASSAHLVLDEQRRPLYIEGSIVDITERIEKEKAQREREAAEASASAKSEFLANMSHEIRTPMNAIIGFATLAQKTELDAKQRDYVAKIEKSSRALLGIINDILDFSKIEAGKLSLELVPFNIYDVVNDIVNILAQKAAEKNLELVVRISPTVPADLVGDPLRLEQVLINLTNNAIKFTSEGEVLIRIKDIQQLDEKCQVQFEVVDTGIGITPEQKQKLFTPFTQADGSTTRKYGGTGLGLSISKQLVELMDGEIWVDSVAGEGSTFAFHAWFGTPAEPISKDIYAVKELKDLRVLVIDDRDSGQEALLEVLASFHCQSTAIQPDYTLITKLQTDYPEPDFDLIVVDRQLRALESVDAARRIQGLPGFTDIPILLMTLANEQHLHEAASQYGFHVLIKPVTPSVMLDSIQAIFGFTGAKSSGAASAAQQPDLARLRGHRVLLVEDTLFNQEIATEFLHQVGLEVMVADNGQIALDVLARETFDAVLMDVQMPVMDGFEATRRIRSQLQLTELPVIAMTANAMKGDRQRCLQAGMNDYVSKPVAQDVLYQTLLRWLAPGTETEAGTTALEVENPIVHPTPEPEAPEMAADKPVSPQPTTSTSPAPIDREQALAQMGGSERLLSKMLARFLSEQEGAIRSIVAAWDGGDTTTAHRLAHTLKGIAGSIGAGELRTAAAELEQALEVGAIPTRIEQLLAQADQQLQRVIDFLKSQQEN